PAPSSSQLPSPTNPAPGPKPAPAGTDNDPVLPQSKPPGPARPPTAPLPPLPSTLIVPAIFTLPVARRYTGVLAALRRNFNVLPCVTVIVVQLKIPLGGTSSVVSAVMFMGP